MECNKEEAFRAKSIAEKKMQDKDFTGARKFAVKAQQLYPDSDNISQLICACNVHCSAEKRIYGNEMDWYGILQIEQSADDILIKKQYRKLALLLHPDKNKFAGAEAAFKLIGEAQRVLCDRNARSLYDVKYRTVHKPVIPKQASQQARKRVNVAGQSRAPNSFTSKPSSNANTFNPVHQVPKQKSQSGTANGKETFWTQCPFCSVRYQYFREVLNRALQCQGCNKGFIAYDMHAQSSQSGMNATTQPVFPQQNVPDLGTSKGGSEAAKNERPTSNSGPPPEKSAEFANLHKHRRMDEQWGQESKSSRKANGKRGKKQVVESSESSESDSSLDADGVELNGDTMRAQRRSTRNKRHVSYNEKGSDDDDDDDDIVNPSKRVKDGGSSSPLTEKHANAPGTEHVSSPRFCGSASASVKDREMGGFDKADGSDDESVLDSSADTIPEPTFYEYPDPEFCDFDKDRKECCFKVGQIWATYDTADAMPRFYAWIRKIFSPQFKLRITWLEAYPDDEVGREWVNAQLPISCGKFKAGNTDTTEDRLMFSHEVSCNKGSVTDHFIIYPRKGETWAVFRKWDANWYLNPEDERKFDYDFVEILSHYDETVGIRVAYLGKLKGFASLFCQKSGKEVLIQPCEILRFAHRVPSYRMTGNERNDVPPGSYELDPGSVAMNLEEIDPPKQDVKSCVIDLTSDFDNPDVAMDIKSTSSNNNKMKGDQLDCVGKLDGDFNGQDIADPEFFNFEVMKSADKFEVNQVWALYSEVDGLPKCYGMVKKVDFNPNFAVYVACFEACYLLSDMIKWTDKNMPISCATFKYGKSQRYASTSSFSHQVLALKQGKKNLFAIYPQKGDVWALYKNWHQDMECSDLKYCEYDIVEVLEEEDFDIKILALERVDGFNSVFQPQKDGSSSITREIPYGELLRFSHQIPSLRMTDEKGGSLRGFWQLDPVALHVKGWHKLKIVQ